MTQWNDLVSRGNSCLEENRFEEARQYYRDALLLGADDLHVLANLTVAEDWARLAFWQALSRQHPDSTPVSLAEAKSWASMGRPERAITIYTGLLRRESIDPKEAIEVHLARLHVAVRARDYDTCVSDFEAIWRAGEMVPGAAALRKDLLRTLAQIDREEAVAMFETLHERIVEPPEVKSFLALKVAELRACAAAVDAAISPGS